MGATCSKTGRSQEEEGAAAEGKKRKSKGKKSKEHVEAVNKSHEGRKVPSPANGPEQPVAPAGILDNPPEALDDIVEVNPRGSEMGITCSETSASVQTGRSQEEEGAAAEEVGTAEQGSTLEQVKPRGSEMVVTCSETSAPIQIERSQEEEGAAAEEKKGKSKGKKSKELLELLKQPLEEGTSSASTSEQLDALAGKLEDLLKALDDFLKGEEVGTVDRGSTSEQVKPTESNSAQSTRSKNSRLALIQQSAEFSSYISITLGDVFKRTGDYARTAFTPQNDVVKTVSRTLAHMGQLHLAGVLLSGFAYLITQWDQFKTNKDRLKKIMVYGLQQGRAVLEAHKTVKGNPHEYSYKVLQEEVAFIFCAINQFVAEIEKSSLRKFFSGDRIKELLDKYENEIHRSFARLNYALTLRVIDKLTKLVEIPESTPLDQDEDDLDKIVPAIGIEGSLQAVKEKLRISNVEGQDAEIGAVAILGMGGIGKSTLAKRLCSQIAGNGFDRNMICQLDMSPGSSNVVQTQQAELLRTLDRKEYAVASDNVMKQRLKNSFQRLQSVNARVFIFIDNVEELEDLEKLLPAPIIKYLPSGSRLLVASRSSYIKGTLEAIGIEPHQIEMFQMELLDEGSSRELFSYYLQRDAELSDGLREVLKVCEGLPLALEVTAKFLKGRDTEEEPWEYVIEALNKSSSLDGSRNDKLSRILEVSYDQLDDEYKDAFLDISFCFNQSSWSDLKILYGERLEILRNRALVKKEVKLLKDSGLRFECAKVHSCFVALCRKKAHVSGSHIRISGSTDSWNLKQIPQVLVVEGGYRGGYQTVEAADLDRQLGSLRILVMTDVKFGGKCVRVPRELKCLYCHHSNVPFPLGDLDSLTLVDISSAADIEYSIPRGVKKLRLDAPSLEILEFASESKLEELGLMFCPRLQSHVKLSALSYLRKLVIRHASYMETLSTRSDTLLSVSIQSCPSLNLPEDLSGLESVEHLHISGSRKLAKLPENPSGLGNLTSLALEDCPLLKKLPGSMDSYPKLWILEVRACGELESLPASFHSWVRDTEDIRGNTDEHRADRSREETSNPSRVAGKWLKCLENAEELKQKALAASYMMPLIHTPGTFDRLNDLVYELYSEQDPDVEIVFLPGISKTLNNREAHWRTWRIKDTEKCWLQTLLPEALKCQEIKARILSVSYESLLNNSLEPESLLMRDLILHPDSSVGQRNVPVILVGHGLGGIVIKYFVRSVIEKLQNEREGVEEDKRDRFIINFCTNLKAFVFYSTPMQGSPVMEEWVASIEENSPDTLLRFLKVLNTEVAVLNEDIAEKRKLFDIRSFALCEMNKTNEGDFHSVLVVPEGSARVDIDSCVPIEEDHYGVAQAKDGSSSSVNVLLNIVADIVDDLKRL